MDKILLWDGKDLADMTKDELIVVVHECCDQVKSYQDRFDALTRMAMTGTYSNDIRDVNG